jgi:tetratricopeptide (TPR) repeat protein
MKKLVTALCLVTLCFITRQAFADSVDLATSHIKAGEYKQAAWIIEEEIKKNPDKAELRLFLGNIYGLDGRTAEADAQYKSAVKLNPALGKEIGSAYREATYFFLDIGQIGQAEKSAMKYVEFQRNKQADFAQELYRRGVKLLKDQSFGPEWGYFHLAGQLNFLLKEKASKDYVQTGHKASAKQCLYFYRKAKDIAGFPDPSAERRVLEQGLELAMSKGREVEFEQYKNELTEFLGSDKVEQALPKFKVFSDGQTEVIRLKAGQRTPYIIAFTVGKYAYSTTSANEKYVIHYTDGTSYNAWELKAMPNKQNGQFWLEALDQDQDITLEVRAL